MISSETIDGSIHFVDADRYGSWRDLKSEEKKHPIDGVITFLTPILVLELAWLFSLLVK